MRIFLYALVLVLVILGLLYGIPGKKGSLWKSVFTLLQIASVARNNSPGYR